MLQLWALARQRVCILVVSTRNFFYLCGKHRTKKRRAPRAIEMNPGGQHMNGSLVHCDSFRHRAGYEMSRDFLRARRELEGRGYVADFMAGFFAEAVSCVLWVPIDVTKERLQASHELQLFLWSMVLGRMMKF